MLKVLKSSQRKFDDSKATESPDEVIRSFLLEGEMMMCRF